MSPTDSSPIPPPSSGQAASPAPILWPDPARQAAFQAWLGATAAAHGLDAASVRAASADASFRRYFRVDTTDGSACRIIMDAPASREALELAGLDWQVESRNIYSGTGAMIPGYRANVRSTDDAVLGVVSDRYRIVQNEEAFQFTDDLLGEGVTYETAGSLQGGKKVWMLARLPRKYLIAGDQVVP